MTTEDLINQSLHCNKLQLDPKRISGKPQFPQRPLVLFTHDSFSEAFSLTLIMVRSFDLIYFKRQSGPPNPAAL